MDLFESARRLVSARFASAARHASGTQFSSETWARGLEALEPRVFLSNTPLPSLTDMTDQNNTVVRMETDFGTIDFEMYDVAGPNGASPAPLTVANFLAYIGSGTYDLSFFHRFARTQNDAKFVLQGGGFKYNDESGLEAVETRDPIANEFDAGRSNALRTIAMARLGGDADSATSQFFINLRNNANFLDDDTSVPGTNDGYTVFGKVLDQRSWLVIQDITALTTEDFRDFTDPTKGALGEVPVKTDSAGPDGIPGNEDDVEVLLSEAELVNITDVEVIKPSNSAIFYRLRAAYPEGYRGQATVESLDLVNPGTDLAIQYQVIVRYEKGMGRDQVISTGQLEPNTHLNLRVNDFADQTLDLVRTESPYAYEVWATGPIGASLNRMDFNATTSESFVNVDSAGVTLMRTWAFGGTGTTIEAPPDFAIQRRPFLVWQNLGFEPAEVTITFTLQTGGRVVWTRTTDPMRRDGLEVFNLQNVTRDIAGIHVAADQRIVAAFTVYDTIVDPSLVIPPLSANNGFTSSGTLGGGLTDGVLAGAMIGEAGTSYVSFVNHGNGGAVVTLTFIRDGEPNATRTLAVPGRGRAFFNLRNMNIPAGERFTILYHTPLSKVAGEYISTINGDTVSTAFATYGASQSIFAGGKYDPTNPDQSEVLSLYNPYSTKNVSVSITFNFADDKIQTPTTFLLDARGRLDISVASLSAIVAKINSGAEFRNYSIIVNVALEDMGGTGGSIGAAGLVAQLTRFDGTSAITTGAGLYQLTLPLDSPAYIQA